MVGWRGWMAALLALLAASPLVPAFAEAKRDFVAGPWNGYAVFDDGEGRFRGCSAGVEEHRKPMLVWTRWADRGPVEVSVRNPPWTLREGRLFRVTLSIDDAWRADAAARVLVGSGASTPALFSVSGQDAAALRRNAPGGRQLTVERDEERRLVFSLAGSGAMLQSLGRCLRRGTALQRKADENDLKAADFFVPQEDAEAFAEWADRLSKTAYSAAVIIGTGDAISRAVEDLSARPAEPEAIKFVFNFALAPMKKEMARAARELAELEPFETASGDRDLGAVLRAATATLLREGDEMLRDVQGLMVAMLRNDKKERNRLYAALAQRSYLSYAGDNIHLLVRNAARSDRQLEYHLNHASRSVNLMNIALVDAILFLQTDALSAKLPALIDSSREHVRNARRWVRSGRGILTDRLADAVMAEETQASRDRIALLGLYAKAFTEEEALADRFEAALTEVEAGIGRGTALDKATLRPLVHGGYSTAAALLTGRFTLRKERWASEGSLPAR